MQRSICTLRFDLKQATSILLRCMGSNALQTRDDIPFCYISSNRHWWELKSSFRRFWLSNATNSTLLTSLIEPTGSPGLLTKYTKYYKNHVFLNKCLGERLFGCAVSEEILVFYESAWWKVIAKQENSWDARKKLLKTKQKTSWRNMR